MAKTLLLADDSVTIQKVVSISFASEDVTLVTVDNGDDAVERAKEIRPDLILADVVMPGKSGYEVCEAIKADPDLRHIPVLLLSGTFEAFDEERAAQVGAAGHVAKPFEAQNLVDQVNRLLSQPPAPALQADPVVPVEATATPVEESPADSFDFFDDDLAELGAAIPDVAAVVPNSELSDEAFALPDDAFTRVEAAPTPEADSGFGGDGGAHPDRTLAIMPDEGDAPDSAGTPPTAVPTTLVSDEPEGGDGELLATVEEEADDSFMTADPASTADEAFDFSFESESTAPESIEVREMGSEAVAAAADELVEGTVLDPIGADGFDVDPISDDGAEGDAGDPVVELEEVIEPAAVIPEPAADAIEPPGPGRGAPMPDESSAAHAEAVLAEISPDLREALHDTLEKIAWEAFGDITDKIVREVVDRVEKVAWEVVPQLTETLIKAEIQRLKGDDD